MAKFLDSLSFYVTKTHEPKNTIYLILFVIYNTSKKKYNIKMCIRVTLHLKNKKKYHIFFVKYF